MRIYEHLIKHLINIANLTLSTKSLLGLKKENKITQKDLIEKAIKFSKEHKNRVISYLMERQISNNSKGMTEKFFSLPKFRLGKNWLKEIDTIEYDDLLRRIKKRIT